MKMLRKISSVFIALSLTLSVVCFVSAASVEKQDLKSLMGELFVRSSKDNNSGNITKLKQYPHIVDALSQMLIDLCAGHFIFAIWLKL